jgi:hypothetical protein
MNLFNANKSMPDYIGRPEHQNKDRVSERKRETHDKENIEKRSTVFEFWLGRRNEPKTSKGHRTGNNNYGWVKLRET